MRTYFVLLLSQQATRCCYSLDAVLCPCAQQHAWQWQQQKNHLRGSLQTLSIPARQCSP